MLKRVVPNITLLKAERERIYAWSLVAKRHGLPRDLRVWIGKNYVWRKGVECEMLTMDAGKFDVALASFDLSNDKSFFMQGFRTTVEGLPVLVSLFTLMICGVKLPDYFMVFVGFLVFIHIMYTDTLMPKFSQKYRQFRGIKLN